MRSRRGRSSHRKYVFNFCLLDLRSGLEIRTSLWAGPLPSLTSESGVGSGRAKVRSLMTCSIRLLGVTHTQRQESLAEGCAGFHRAVQKALGEKGQGQLFKMRL